MPAELLTRHAFVDLETTGLDASRDEVIEVGALFVERGQVVGRLSQLCRASKPLPLAIRRITGLSDDALAGQPPFADLVPKLKTALTGFTVVAHNAAFERSFLADLLRDIRAPVLDSCELLHYLYPELESHSLESAIRWAGVGEHAAHRALKDCEDTFAVVSHALSRCIEEARSDDLADLLATLSPGPSHTRELDLDGSSSQRPLLELLERTHDECRARAAPLRLTPSSSFLPARPERQRQLPAEPPPEEGLRPVLPGELQALLGSGGALERTVPGFSPRPAQLEMARKVAGALNDGGTVAVEAGTGTGKSLAYLAPAALFAARNRLKVAVAPHTKTLQDQLVEKDIPKLHRATGGAFGYAVLKGQSNYLCRRRALEVTRAEPGLPEEERAPRAYLRAFLRRSPDGDLDRLSFWFRERYPALSSLVAAARSEAATTLGEACPHYARCFYHSAVAQAKEADVLVINQSLALTWPARYPEVRHLVLDEAHELEDAVTAAFAAELSEAGLIQLLERLSGGPTRRGVARELRRALGDGPAAEAAAELTRRAGQLSAGVERLGEAVFALCAEASEARSVEAYGAELRVTSGLRASRSWAQASAALLELGAKLAKLIELLSVQLPATLPQLGREHPGLERELAGAVDGLQESWELALELASHPSDARCYCASIRSLGPRAGGGRWSLRSEPIEVAPNFAEGLAADKRSLVLTSATLSTAPDRPWVLERLGLTGPDRPKAQLHRADTPFDLPGQALVVLVTDAPDPQDEAFTGWAAARICGLAQFLGGRLLGLFASTRRLEAVGEQVRATLEPAGIEVLRQRRGHGRNLAARQEQDFGSVLLGTKSFWQGVDIPGPGVGCVFIDKLPVEPRSRPIVAAREEHLASAGAPGFLRYRLPRALLLLRQGVGRLIRSGRDRGVVVIADPGSPSYRRELVAALAGYRVQALPWSEARVLIHQTLTEMGLSVQDEGSRAASTPLALNGAPTPAWP